MGEDGRMGGWRMMIDDMIGERGRGGAGRGGEGEGK